METWSMLKVLLKGNTDFIWEGWYTSLLKRGEQCNSSRVVTADELEVILGYVLFYVKTTCLSKPIFSFITNNNDKDCNLYWWRLKRQRFIFFIEHLEVEESPINPEDDQSTLSIIHYWKFTLNLPDTTCWVFKIYDFSKNLVTCCTSRHKNVVKHTNYIWYLVK